MQVALNANYANPSGAGDRHHPKVESRQEDSGKDLWFGLCCLLLLVVEFGSSETEKRAS